MSRRLAILGRPSLVGNSAWLVATTSTTGAAAADYFRSIPIPSDVRAVAVSGGNRRFDGGTGSDIVLSKVAAGESDGAGGFGSAPVTFTNRTVPGDGSVGLLVPSSPVVRGPDKTITLAYSYPGAGGVDDTAYTPNLIVGNYAAHTGNLYPTPTFAGIDSNPLFQLFISYRSARPAWHCIGDSILVGGAVPASGCGYLNAAWIKIARDKDFAVTIDGMPGAFLSYFADPMTYPVLWDNQNLVGKNVCVQGGVNDTAHGSSASDMVGWFEDIAAICRARGAVRVGATTVLPSKPYGSQVVRNAYNSTMLGGGSSANFVVDICPAVWDPSDHDSLNPIYKTDDIHPNTAGQAQIAAAIELALGF